MSQATVTPEAWAEAQVNAVAREVEAKEKPKGKGRKAEPPAKVRGVFFRLNPNGRDKDHLGRPGDWWTRWRDGTFRASRSTMCIADR